MPFFRRSIHFLCLSAIVSLYGCGGGSSSARDRIVPGTSPSNGSVDIVYGGTPAGVTAALEAARLGKTVALLEPSNHLGGMMTNGISFSDTYTQAAWGGIATEIFQHIDDAYAGSAIAAHGTHFEPHVAESVIKAMLTQQPRIDVHLAAELDHVVKSGTSLSAVVTVDGSAYVAKQFVDASYTGDLMAAAGVSYASGREAVATYNESLAGAGPPIEVVPDVDPYNIPGDPTSGLLPHLDSTPTPPVGSADSAIMAYNYRLCLSSDVSNQVPFTPPAGYSVHEFEALGRLVDQTIRSGSEVPITRFLFLAALPGNKFDVNNAGFMSTDYPGANRDYVGGSADTRAAIEREHQRYTQAYLYFLSTDPRIPSAIQSQIRSLGYCKDEFTDNNGWPHRLYVREARRMVGSYVVTQHDALGEITVDQSIGRAGYPFDQHFVHRYVQNGKIFVEGTGAPRPAPLSYPIAYGAIVPLRTEATNLLVAVALSASHVALESIRLELTYMIIGQSAGAAASLAIDDKVAVQDVSYSRLSAQLGKDKQVL
jgi:hypothetical protein